MLVSSMSSICNKAFKLHGKVSLLKVILAQQKRKEMVEEKQICLKTLCNLYRLHAQRDFPPKLQ